jgi:iron complex outermembrane receptor protein
MKMVQNLKIRKLHRQLILAGLMSVTLQALAEEVATTEKQNAIVMAPVVVTGTRIEQNSFDLPMSIDATDAEQIQEGQLKVNLSESSGRVPGVVINNRNNPAQDLAIQIRGFGARSAFGVRGVRLYADGIPMTMPDGQGQTGTFNLDTASRVEYLRGPFSALYGNSSGGVVQIFTQDGPKEPTLSGGITFGSYNTRRETLTFGDSGDGYDYITNANTYRGDGYRDQSATRRDTLHAKLNFKLNDDTKLTLVATALDQPDNKDPQGLDAIQLKADPKQAGTNSVLFNTRVSKSHEQVGATLEHNFTADDTARLMAYYGQRDNEQYQSVSVLAQTASPGFQRSGGGVAVIARVFGGVDARWTHKGALADMPLNLTAGMSYDLMNDDRTGYENFIGSTLGVKGNLRRDERNEARSFDQYVQASLDVLPRWSLSGGARHSRVGFETIDHFIAVGNGNDSGSVSFSETTPVVGTIFKVTDSINLFANAGSSFETPTFVEMAYNPDFNKSGLNLDLKPSKSRQYEVGAKAMVGNNTLVNLALFKIDTDNEIVVATSQGGRTTYRNVPTSERKGLELSLDSHLPENIRLYLAYTLLDAKFSDSFSACQTPFPNGSSCRFGTAGDFETIASGSKIPGTYRYNLYGEISWKYQPSGFSTALEMRKSSDTNVSFNPADGQADGYTVFNWRGGLSQAVNSWNFTEYLRVENIFDRDYVGSVRVADGNQRFYEPAPGRNWLIGLNAGYKF